MREFVKNSEAYAGRPNYNYMKYMLEGCYGLVFNYNILWKSQRRFALHVLRDFGFGKPILEDTILDQANQMTVALKQLNGSTIDITNMITVSFQNLRKFIF